MIAIQTMGNVQRKYKTPFTAFLDSEEATTVKRLSKLGVNSPAVKPYTDITIEKIFKFLEGLCIFKEEKNMIDIPAIVVWDSIANTLSQKERETEDINSVIGYKARLLSILVPKYISKLANYNICLLAVNQLRDNLAMGQFAPAPDLKFMTSSKQMPGGNVLKFNAFHLVEMKVKSALKPEKYGFEGIISRAKCVKNKLFRPNVEVEIVGDFTHGFTNFWTNYNFLVETKRMKTGAWNYLINLPESKFRTKEAINLYKTDKKFKEAFDEAASDAIKIDIIEKYN
jgi:RecA/RadA recombinase